MTLAKPRIVVPLPPPVYSAEIDPPPAALSSNAAKSSARLHKAAAVKAYRESCGWAFATAKRAGFRQLSEAVVLVTVVRRTSNPRRDADGVLASLKAAFDALQDAGVIGNDRGLSFLPVQWISEPATGKPRPLRVDRIRIELFDVDLVIDRGASERPDGQAARASLREIEAGLASYAVEGGLTRSAS